MLFLTPAGLYIEVLRRNYTTDTAYYQAILTAKGYTPLKSPPNTVSLVQTLVYSSSKHQRF
jgi:hypothetical protein